MSEDRYAFRFEYADKSAFQIYANGQVFIVYKDGRREEKKGIVINRIPQIINIEYIDIWNAAIEAADFYQIPYMTMYMRLRMGLKPATAVKKPVRKYVKKSNEVLTANA